MSSFQDVSRQPITLHVEGRPEVRSHRLQVAERVRDQLLQDSSIPQGVGVLCYLDERNSPELMAAIGPANRGVYGSITRGQPLRDWPQKMWGLLAPIPSAPQWPFTDAIYLHGSTCETDVGLALTLAHELQHFLQHAREYRIWAANQLLQRLNKEDLRCWADVPTEREARIVSKRIAEAVYGHEAVRGHITKQIHARVTADDAEDWRFVLAIDSTQDYSAAGPTKFLVKKYCEELKRLQNDPGIAPHLRALDLDECFWNQ